MPRFCLPGAGQDALGAFQLVDKPDPDAGVGLYGGGTSTTLEEIFASDRIVHLGFLLISVYAVAGQGRSASAPYRMVFSFVENNSFAVIVRMWLILQGPIWDEFNLSRPEGFLPGSRGHRKNKKTARVSRAVGGIRTLSAGGILCHLRIPYHRGSGERSRKPDRAR